MEPDDMSAISYSLGHNLYTPSDITIAAAQPDDRPYAAFVRLSRADDFKRAIISMKSNDAWRDWPCSARGADPEIRP